jgi:hypothetical protein
MKELKEFFTAISKEKKISSDEVEAIVSSSFDDLFLCPLKEEFKLKPKKQKKPKPLKQSEPNSTPLLLERSLGLLTEPTSTKNQDPLTPIDQKFMTVEAFQKHYQLFLARVQQQLSTIGGGGEVRIEFLDDVYRDSVKRHNKFLRYNSTIKKWEGADCGSNGMRYSTVIVNSSSYTPSDTDYYIGVDYQGAVTITLPPNAESGTCYVIKDELGQASQGTNRYIEILPSGNDTIDGKNKVTIAIDYGSVTLIYRNGWRVV